MNVFIDISIQHLTIIGPIQKTVTCGYQYAYLTISYWSCFISHCRTFNDAKYASSSFHLIVAYWKNYNKWHKISTFIFNFF